MTINSVYDNINKINLTIKQEKFCHLYAETGNAAQSYRDAGYTASNNASASTMAVALLKKPRIKARLQQLLDEYHTEKVMEIREAQEILTRVARNEETEEFVTGDGRREMKRAALKDRLKAIELLLKCQGAFADTNNLAGAQVNVIVADDVKRK